MKSFIFYFFFSLSIIQVKLYLSFEKRQFLLNKLAKKISASDMDQYYTEFIPDFSNDFKKMNYNISDIEKLMDEYGLPKSFNYTKETGAKIIVKEQGRCGCCWAFSSTTSLAYRYKKYGIDVNLSPQDGLSCYIPDCDHGDNILDPQLNLIKNGTVTEECFPYVSKDGKTIPKCPSKCVNGSEFKKYHSQNAYRVNNNNQKDFYDLVILIMDQLVTQGPIVGGFYVYEDFEIFGRNPDKCLNDVYTYDGVSANSGGHGVSITGYGFHKNKIYWLVQNSWGSNWCDNGFIKMEIGQFFGIAFSEPNVRPASIHPVSIDISYLKQDSDCNLVVSTTSSLDEWNNTLNVKFTHENEEQDIEFQIGVNKIRGKNEIKCNYEIKKVHNLRKRGTYEYKGYESLGVENNFTLISFDKRIFYFHGTDKLAPYRYSQYYVSQIGSKIIFQQENKAGDDDLPPIYKNGNTQYPMQNCFKLKTSTKLDANLWYCEITKEDLNYIQKNPHVKLYHSYLCKYVYDSNITLDKLNIELYPVFKVFNFSKPADKIITQKTNLIIVANVTGSSKYFQNDLNYFHTFIEIENQNKNKTAIVNCGAQINYENKESKLTCHLLDASASYEYENLYLLPYSAVTTDNSIFEVIIETTIKAEVGPDPEPTDPEPTDPEPTDPKPTDPTPTPTKSSYPKYSLRVILGLILLFL